MSYSTCGRPRILTDTQISEILAWHATRVSCRAMAHRLGISVRLLQRVIRTMGKHYKRASPDLEVA